MVEGVVVGGVVVGGAVGGVVVGELVVGVVTNGKTGFAVLVFRTAELRVVVVVAPWTVVAVVVVVSTGAGGGVKVASVDSGLPGPITTRIASIDHLNGSIQVQTCVWLPSE